MDPLYVVLIINLIIWLGIFLYVNKTDREIKRLKKEVEELGLNSQKENR
ncbi:CcmD family protein [candidate division KSB1 bacterium]|nr:MAG: CcmD family protein [candidate division KSB1 bacterium]